MRVDGENLQLHNFTFKVNTYRQSLKYERASRNVLSPLKLEIKINLIIIVGGFWMELEWRGLITPKHCEKNKIIFFDVQKVYSESGKVTKFGTSRKNSRLKKVQA